MTFYVIYTLAAVGIGLLLGYLFGAYDKRNENNAVLGDSILETIKWKRDSEILSEALAEQVGESEELNVLINKLKSDLQVSQGNFKAAIDELTHDAKAYQGRIERLLAEKNITRMELDILESELDDLIEDELRRKLHNTVQDQLTRKWSANKRATLATARGFISSNSNND